MKESFKDIPGLHENWDFWFSHTKKIPKNSPIKINKESYYFILNSESCEIEYVSKSITDVLGYFPEEFRIENLFSSIHPDDLEYCKRCEYDSIQLSNNLYFNEQHRYSFQYTYRLKTKDNVYITVLQQYQTIEVDDYGHLLKTLVLHEKIGDYEIRPENDFKIFDKLNNKSINLPAKYKLTKREWQILGLIQKGYKSNEISEMLYLSKYTVDTHRKNILFKTDSNSLMELINKVEL